MITLTGLSAFDANEKYSTSPDGPDIEYILIASWFLGGFGHVRYNKPLPSKYGGVTLSKLSKKNGDKLNGSCE